MIAIAIVLGVVVLGIVVLVLVYRRPAQQAQVASQRSGGGLAPLVQTLLPILIAL